MWWHLFTKDCGLDLSLGQFWSDKAVVTVQSGLCQLGRGLSVMLRGESLCLLKWGVTVVHQGRSWIKLRG